MLHASLTRLLAGQCICSITAAIILCWWQTSASLVFQHGLGLFEAFTGRLWWLRHPALWTKQLLASQPNRAERAIFELLSPYCVSWSNKYPFKKHIVTLSVLFLQGIPHIAFDLFGDHSASCLCSIAIFLGETLPSLWNQTLVFKVFVPLPPLHQSWVFTFNSSWFFKS